MYFHSNYGLTSCHSLVPLVSVQEVSKRIGYLETGTSAGLRTLRKKPYGKKNGVGKWLGGVYHYRLEEGEYGEKPLSYDLEKTIEVDLV